MSYFSGEPKTPEPNAGTESDWIEKVKATKGEQWQDPNVLAKGYLASQDHINSLERQIEEMREDLGKRATAQEILEQLKQSQAKPTGGEQTANSTSGEGANTKPSEPEDIKTLIEETLTQREAQRTAEQNLQEADRKLAERFGTEATAVVEAKAKQLGLSKERLKEIASESPTAFLSLVGEGQKTESNQLPKSNVNTATDEFSKSSDARTWKYYQDLRRTNPKMYYSPRVQRQMEKDYADGKIQIPT